MTLLIVIVFLLCLNLGLTGFVLWVLSNLRDDQLLILGWLRERYGKEEHPPK